MRGGAEEGGQARHLPAPQHLVGHAAVEAVDAEHAHVEPGRDHREVGRDRGRARREVGGGGDGAAEEEGGGGQERQHAAAREARFRELVAHAARGQHGHGRQRAEAAQRRAQRDAQQHAGELREGGGAPGMRAPPQGHVAEAGHAQRHAHVPADGGAGPAPAAPRPPSGGQAGQEHGRSRQQREREHEIDGEDEQVPRLAAQARVQERGRQRQRRAEEEPAQHAHARGRPRRGAHGPRGRRARQHEAVEAVLEVAQAPQLVADLVDGRERGPRRRHGRDSTRPPLPTVRRGGPPRARARGRRAARAGRRSPWP